MAVKEELKAQLHFIVDLGGVMENITLDQQLKA
jgi:hypothetical protein